MQPPATFKYICNFMKDFFISILWYLNKVTSFSKKKKKILYQNLYLAQFVITGFFQWIEK